MTFEILTIPCRTDNYAFLIILEGSDTAALVDAPEAAPIAAALTARSLRLSDILITHHHDDHISAVAELADAGTRVIGAEADAHRLPKLDLAVSGGDQFELLSTKIDVIDVEGHTRGHIAFHMPAAEAVFTADSLMALGCGRLFEGTPDDMWGSLSKLSALPPETMVYSGHEYTASNANFALTIEPSNKQLKARAEKVFKAAEAGIPTVPSSLAEELATNPFLRAGLPEVKASLGMSNENDISVFAEIRRRKDRF